MVASNLKLFKSHLKGLSSVNNMEPLMLYICMYEKVANVTVSLGQGERGPDRQGLLFSQIRQPLMLLEVIIKSCKIKVSKQGLFLQSNVLRSNPAGGSGYLTVLLDDKQERKKMFHAPCIRTTSTISSNLLTFMSPQRDVINTYISLGKKIRDLSPSKRRNSEVVSLDFKKF